MPELLRPREEQVMEALAAGSSYAEIAEYLGINYHTVGIHVRNAALAFGVRGKDAALEAFARAGGAVGYPCPVCEEPMRSPAPACGFCRADR